MPIKTVLAADLFCGAGGTSTGLRQACEAMGINLKLVAVNHWQLAISTHKTNHPEVDHHCTNLDNVDPRKLVPGGKLDLLVASAEFRLTGRDSLCPSGAAFVSTMPPSPSGVSDVAGNERSL